MKSRLRIVSIVTQLLVMSWLMLPLQIAAETVDPTAESFLHARDLGEEFSRVSGTGTIEEARKSLNKLEALLDRYLASLDPDSVTKASVEGARFFVEAAKVDVASLRSDLVALSSRLPDFRDS